MGNLSPGGPPTLHRTALLFFQTRTPRTQVQAAVPLGSSTSSAAVCRVGPGDGEGAWPLPVGADSHWGRQQTSASRGDQERKSLCPYYSNPVSGRS